MKFITLQDAPSRQFKDDNGATKVEFTNYSNITVPVNKSLGFAPMWAIPITTFKETLADLLLCAPNCPRFVCIFESNNYVRVDKLKHYRNIMDGLYDDVPDTLSQLIRTAFIPRQGMKFIVADFSAIEARVIAWLAGEEWRMKAFANGEDIYCASASKMFGVPVVKHGENGQLRQKGKISELA